MFIIPVRDLVDLHILEAFKKGYQQYKTEKQVTKNNYHVEWLQKNSPDHYYKKLNIDKLINSVSNKMNIFDSMESTGFDHSFPIVLLRYKFNTKFRKVISDKDGKEIIFDVYDGHHRVVSAYCLGIKYVPCVYGEWNKRDIGSIEKESNSHQWTWYQPIDFKSKTNIVFESPDNHYHGDKKYDFILRRNLEPIKGYRFVDLGCNTGVISARIAADYADNVVGIDYPSQMLQTWTVYETLWNDYGNLSFHGLDLKDTHSFDCFIKGIDVDCMLMSNFVYYLGDHTDDFVSVCSKYASRIVLQGNSPKTEYVKNYRREYASIDGMVSLMERHGYTCEIDAPEKYSKPVVKATKIRRNLFRSFDL